ncbi:hypothetical protein BGC33_05610, partial [Bathymodiolus thermophilus thioautotrophic gill symbiont]
IAGRTAIAATAGGAVAVLGGGKFSNGARSAAFVHLFNAEGMSLAKTAGDEIRRIFGLSEGAYNNEFSQYGYTGGTDKDNVFLSKLSLKTDLTKIVSNGINKQFKPTYYDIASDPVSMMGNKLGIFGSILNAVGLYNTLNTNTKYIIHYKCLRIDCHVSGYGKK